MPDLALAPAVWGGARGLGHEPGRGSGDLRHKSAGVGQNCARRGGDRLACWRDGRRAQRYPKRLILRGTLVKRGLRFGGRIVGQHIQIGIGACL